LEDSVKVLIATRQTQGAYEDDFSDTVEGELVFDAGPCENVTNPAYWNCACAIGFHGVASGELTTTAMVADLPIELHEYERAVRDGTREWCCKDCARFYARKTRMLALRFPVGTVIERFQEEFRVRALRALPPVPSVPSAPFVRPAPSVPSAPSAPFVRPAPSVPSAPFIPSAPYPGEADFSTD